VVVAITRDIWSLVSVYFGV